MTVYVDDMRARVGRQIVCHMMADSNPELERMARRIGLPFRWRHRDHYDVPESYRAAAITAGAVEITRRDMVRVRQRLRKAPQ